MKRLLILLTCMPITLLHAQEIRSIKLKQKPINYAVKRYHIDGIKDDRADTTKIGFMHVGFFKKIATINLDNGATSSITQFLQRNLKQDEHTPSVDLHIIKLDISEKPGFIVEQADLALGIAFYQGGNKIAEYTGSSYVQTTKDANAYIESMIRQRLEEVLRKFDEDFVETPDEGVAPGGVQREVTILKQSDNDDQLFYSRDRPLQLDDFKGPIDDLSAGAAATASGIGMKYSHEKKGASVTIKVSLYCYFEKTKSWCKPSAKVPKTLSHEQRHFDITAIKCYELADAIRNYKFSVDDYTKELDALLRQFDKEMGNMQRQYDQETKHGLIKEKQAKWDTDIKAKLADIKM